MNGLYWNLAQICRFWSLSLVTFVLTVSNIVLTIRLLHDPTVCIVQPDYRPSTTAVTHSPNHASNNNVQLSCGGNDRGSPENDPIGMTNYSQSHRLVFDDLNLMHGRWDSSRQYKFFDFASVGVQYVRLNEKYKVCLATQSSLERLHSLISVSKHWTGPISLAVFVAGDDELYLLQLYLSYMQKCFGHIRDAVTIHLAYPKNRAPTIVRRYLKTDYENFICEQPELTLKALMKFRTSDTIKWRLKNPYPQNHLRNLARKGCQNDFVFLTDIDIIPSINFTENLDKFLRAASCPGQRKCAYVVPTYEIDNRAKFPQNKSDLLRLVRKGLARPFHHKVFIYNQYATNFSRYVLHLFQ